MSRLILLVLVILLAYPFWGPLFGINLEWLNSLYMSFTDFICPA